MFSLLILIIFKTTKSSFFMLVQMLRVIYKSEHLTFLHLCFLEITSTGYHTTFKSPFQQLQVQI